VTESPYRVTGEPDLNDREAVEIYTKWNRPLSYDQLVSTLERVAHRSQPCMFGRVFLSPADMHHLRQVSYGLRAEPGLFAPYLPPLFSADAIVDANLPAGVQRLATCTNTLTHADCRYAQPVYLVTTGQSRHSDFGCALSRVGVVRVGVGQCLDGTLYAPCGADECEGGCENLGSCGCSCHG
jgi:hypothetical protein